MTRDASATLGVTYVLQKSKQPAQSVNAFGCALSHRAVLIAAAQLEFPSDIAWVFEDDAYCSIAPKSINTTLEGLLCAALEAGHAVDIVHCGQTSGCEHWGSASLRWWMCPSQVPLSRASPCSHEVLLRILLLFGATL